MGGTDIDIGLIVNLSMFIEEECMAGLGSVERALNHKHFQMMEKGKFNSLLP